MVRGNKTTTEKSKTIIPSESNAKSILRKNYIIAILNDYYRNNGDINITFHECKSDEKSSNIIDLKKYNGLIETRHQIESMIPGDDFSDKLTVAEVHSPTYYLSTYRKRIANIERLKLRGTGVSLSTIRKTKISYPIDFVDIVKSSGIRTSPKFDVKSFVANCLKYIRSDRMTLKIFNHVFTYTDSTKKRNIDRIPLQRTPSDMMELIVEIVKNKDKDGLLEESWKRICASLNRPGIPLAHVAAITDPRIKEAVISGKPLFTKDAITLTRRETITNNRTNTTIKIDTSDSSRSDELRLSRMVYQQFKAAKQTIEKVIELMGKSDFNDRYSKFIELNETRTSIATQIAKVKITSAETSQVGGFAIVLSKMNEMYKSIDPSKEDHLQSILSVMQKYGSYVNLRTPAFRKAIISGSISSQVSIGKEFVNELEGMGIVKSHDMTSQDTYAKIGYYLFFDWDCTSPVVRVPKSVRTALGLAIFKYIIGEVDKKIASHKKSKSISIAINL